MKERRARESIETYISEVGNLLEELSAQDIAQIVAVLDETRQAGGRVFVFGNGGSAATASHFASDLAKGAICEGKRRMRAFALTDNVPLLSAWANDCDYASVFAEQLEGFIEEDDVAIGISGSGNSQNVLDGIRLAREKGATTIGFIGFGGGRLKDIVDLCVIVGSHDMRQVEDLHLLLTHALTTCLAEG